MLSHSKYYFESPARRLFLDGGPSEGGTPRADLFSGGLGETKNVTEWVKNGETTLEAKALARSLQERIEAIKRETDLQLIQEYRYVFDEYILAPESYDSPETVVNDSFKGKGALYVLEQTCPLLKAQFRTYPDLRYLAYASATKQVPDVDVLPMGSTISMVDGTVHLKRPGKADASFSLFPWDYRAEIEKKYQELKPKPVDLPPPPVTTTEPMDRPTVEPEVHEEEGTFAELASDFKSKAEALRAESEQLAHDAEKGVYTAKERERALELRRQYDVLKSQAPGLTSKMAEAGAQVPPDAGYAQGSKDWESGLSALTVVEQNPLIYTEAERHAKLEESWSKLESGFDELERRYPNISITTQDLLTGGGLNHLVVVTNKETDVSYEVMIHVKQTALRMPLSYNEPDSIVFSVERAGSTDLADDMHITENGRDVLHEKTVSYVIDELAKLLAGEAPAGTTPPLPNPETPPIPTVFPIPPMKPGPLSNPVPTMPPPATPALPEEVVPVPAQKEAEEKETEEATTIFPTPPAQPEGDPDF